MAAMPASGSEVEEAGSELDFAPFRGPELGRAGSVTTWQGLSGPRRGLDWLVHWGGRLRDRTGRLDAAVLSGVEAFISPKPIRADASRSHSNGL